MILFVLINCLLMMIISILGWCYLLSPSHTKKNYGKKFNKIMCFYLFYSMIFIVVERSIPEDYKNGFAVGLMTLIKIIELPSLILFTILGQFLYKKHKTKTNLNDNKVFSFTEWKESKSDIINRLNLYRSVKVLEAEKQELTSLNNTNIFKEVLFFSQHIYCKNIQQICFTLKLKYGTYNKDWQIEDLEINGNNIKFKLILNNKKVKTLNFKRIKD